MNLIIDEKGYEWPAYFRVKSNKEKEWSIYLVKALGQRKVNRISMLENNFLDESCQMEGYIRYLIENKGISQSSGRTYVNNVRRFHNFVGKSYVDIKPSDIKRYLLFLQNEELLKKTTLYIHFTAIKKFYEYLLDRGEIAKNPSDGISIKYRNKYRSPQNHRKL